MTLTLVNTALAGLLALVAVPLLLHLFARTKPPVYEFSSVEFLRRVVRKTMRLRKPQDWLLLVLRTLAVLALVGVFLRPLWFPQEKISGLFEKKNLVVIVDASASMGLVEGAQTRFATACAEASELLGGLTARDRANVVWLDAEPDPVFPDGLATNLSFLRDQLRRARVSSERGAPEKAFGVALQLLDGTEGSHEICMVSDFQREAWKDFRPDLPESIKLIQVKVGERDEAPNLAVTDLWCEPADPVAGEDLRVYAEVRNFSGETVQTTVFSEAGESRRSANLTVEPWAEATAIFHHILSEEGTVPLAVSVAEDEFPGDDRRHLVVGVRPYLRVGIWSDGSELGSRTARVWTRATQSLGWAVPETLDAASLAGAGEKEFDALFLAGWDGSIDGLEIPADTLLVTQPSETATLDALDSLYPGVVGTIRREQREESEPPYSLVVAKPEDELFALFRGGEFGDPAGPAGWNRLVFGEQAKMPERTTPLLSWSDAAGALLRVDTGRYLWMVPVAEEASSWAGRVEFVPLFAELLMADRGRIGSGDPGSSLDFEPGESLLWTVPDGIEKDGVALWTPEGTSLGFRVDSPSRLLSEPARIAGLHTWKEEGDAVGFTAVNFPAEPESDLRSLGRDEVASMTEAVVVSGGDEVRNLRDGLELWPWLLAIAAALLLGESLVMWWAARTA